MGGLCEATPERERSVRRRLEARLRFAAASAALFDSAVDAKGYLRLALGPAHGRIYRPVWLAYRTAGRTMGQLLLFVLLRPFDVISAVTRRKSRLLGPLNI